MSVVSTAVDQICPKAMYKANKLTKLCFEHSPKKCVLGKRDHTSMLFTGQETPIQLEASLGNCIYIVNISLMSLNMHCYILRHF